VLKHAWQWKRAELAEGESDMSKQVTALDIGTTKICVVVGEITEEGELKVVGVGQAPAEGLRRGVVVNLEKTVRSIRKAVAEAERISGMQIKSAAAGIAGDHIRSINSRGVIAVSGRDNEIGEKDVRRVIEAAKAVAIPTDREIIHVIPQQFMVDDQDGIKDPVGMTGIRLEAEVHIITGAASSARNIVRAIERAGLKVEDLVLEPLASSYAVLDEDEKDLGAVVLDMGGGTTDLALFFEGSIRHTAVIGLGGANVTSDIAIGLRTPLEKAEAIKLDKGCAAVELLAEDEDVLVPGVGGRPERKVSRKLLASMIEPRMEEIFLMAKREVEKNQFTDVLGAGLVLTGGSSLMEGSVELAERVFGMSVRTGIPMGVSGLVEAVADPRLSTGVGLLIHYLRTEEEESNLRRPIGAKISDGLKRLFASFV